MTARAEVIPILRHRDEKIVPPDAPKWWCGGCSPEHYGILQLNPDTPYGHEPCSSCVANQRAEIVESLPELVGELQAKIEKLIKRVAYLEGATPA